MLIYCVCSLEREEGEEQARMGDQRRGSRPARYGRQSLTAGLLPVTEAGFVRTHPGQIGSWG